MLRRLQPPCTRSAAVTAITSLALLYRKTVGSARMYTSQPPNNANDVNGSYHNGKVAKGQFNSNNVHNDDAEIDLFEDDFYFLDQLFDEGLNDMRDFIPESDAKLLDSE